MPKITEKADAYYVEPTLAENLGQVMMAIAGVLQGRQQRKEKQKKDVEASKEAQSDALLKLANLADTQPELANLIQSLPGVRDVISPLTPELKKHENEGLITSMRHKGQHADLKTRAAAFVPRQFEVSPQLKSEREKKASEARQAEMDEAIRKTRNEMLLGTEGKPADPDDLVRQLVLLGIPVNEENAALLASKGKTGVQSVSKGIPYTPEWIADKVAGISQRLFEERPDVEPQMHMQYARSLFDPNAPQLTSDFYRAYRKSKTGQEQDLAAKGVQLRERELNLNVRTANERAALEKGKLAQMFVNNGLESDAAWTAAEKLLTTGKYPEGFEIPKDKKADLDAQIAEAQLLRFQHDLTVARAKSPKFDMLGEMAAKLESDDPRRAGMVEEMYSELCKFDSTSRYCAHKEGMGMFKTLITAGLASQYAVHGRPAIKGAAMGVGMAGDALRGTASFLADPLGSLKVEGAIPIAPRGGAIPGVPTATVKISPELDAKASEFADRIAATLKDPRLTVEQKKQIGALAEALKKALESGDTETLNKIWQLGGIQ